MFIGQETLKAQFEQLIINGKLPQFVILEGVAGSGKKMMANFMAEKMDAYVQYVEALKIDNIREIIGASNTLNRDVVYVLPNAEDITIQAENALLKLAEEPPKHCHIVMTVLNRGNVLPTIQSRAKIFRIEAYTEEHLKMFTRDGRLLNVCETPGQVMSFIKEDMEGLFNFVDKVIDNIEKVSIMNMLAIPNYLNVDGKSTDKYDIKLFLNVIIYKLSGMLKDKNKCRNSYAMMSEVVKAKGLLDVTAINKQAVIDTMLIRMRKVLK
jgi:replication-associated recombination protein RarA